MGGGGVFRQKASQTCDPGGGHRAPYREQPALWCYRRRGGPAMTEQLKQIAARIRDLREIAGLSQESAARDFGVPLEVYAAYEAGTEDMPVSVLHQIATRFGVELTALLTGEEPRLHAYCLVRKGKGVAVERRHEYGYQSLAFNFIHKRAEPFLVTVEPDEEAVLHLNSHPGQEFNYVLEGSLRVVIEGHELVLEEGDALFFEGILPHGMLPLGKRRARFLALIC
jgi:transcriptional regulator with XRE-family HTH domain